MMTMMRIKWKIPTQKALASLVQPQLLFKRLHAIAANNRIMSSILFDLFHNLSISFFSSEVALREKKSAWLSTQLPQNYKIMFPIHFKSLHISVWFFTVELYLIVSNRKIIYWILLKLFYWSFRIILRNLFRFFIYLFNNPICLPVLLGLPRTC